MDSTQTDKSIYQALDANTSEIRLMTLHPGSGDEELRCTLKTVSLDDQPEFHALSYVWGAATEKRRIHIDNHSIPVASNLATILDHFHSHHYDFLQLHSVPLWIDAICINQADPNERAQQVRLMKRIYRQASRVLVWLGERDEFSDYAFDRINNETFRASLGELNNASRAPTPEEVRVRAILLKNLNVRRYWARAWTLQEFALASQDPTMFCGSRWMLWSWYDQCETTLLKLDLFYNNLAFDQTAIAHEVPILDHDNPYISCDEHRLMREWYHQDSPIRLADALSQSFQLDATDPRDLIYGVLGLVPHREMVMVDIDYEKPLERVLTDTMAAIWTSDTDGLIGYLIPLIMSAGWADDKSKVPSWVPDVFDKTKVNYEFAHQLKKSEWRPERQPDIHVQDDTLIIDGIQFDSIADTTMVLHFNHEWGAPFQRGKAPGEVDVEFLQNIEAMAHRGLDIPIPASSRLSPFVALRDKMPIWSALTVWREDQNGGKSDKLLLHGVAREESKLWEILLGRQEIPEDWKMAAPVDLRNNLPALEATLLRPLLQAITRGIDGKKVFITRSGFLGISTEHVEAGDIIILIKGMTAMYVLRPFRDGYRMVGFAIVSGLMDWDDLDQAMEAGTLHKERMKIY